MELAISWLSDNLANVLIGAGLLVLILLIVRRMAIKRKRGGTGCSSCSGCAASSHCRSAKPE